MYLKIKSSEPQSNYLIKSFIRAIFNIAVPCSQDIFLVFINALRHYLQSICSQLTNYNAIHVDSTIACLFSVRNILVKLSNMTKLVCEAKLNTLK